MFNCTILPTVPGPDAGVRVPATRPLEQQPISGLRAKSPRHEDPHHIDRGLRAGAGAELRAEDPELPGHRVAAEDLPDRPQDPGAAAPQVGVCFYVEK